VAPWSLLPLTLVIGGCATERDVAPPPQGPDADAATAASGEPTFTAVYEEVIRTSNCTLGLCHGEGARGGDLDLTPREDAYDHLVGVASRGSECAALGHALVEPGAPGRSLLYLKLDPEPPCGAQMPPGGGLTADQVAQVRRWIERGAPND
jgi:hypothetical protein